MKPTYLSVNMYLISPQSPSYTDLWDIIQHLSSVSVQIEPLNRQMCKTSSFPVVGSPQSWKDKS